MAVSNVVQVGPVPVVASTLGFVFLAVDTAVALKTDCLSR